MNSAEAELLATLVRRSYIYRPQRPFVLASGKTSPIYIDCRTTTTFAAAMPLVGRALFERVRQASGERLVDGVGGLTMGADPIASAIAFHSAVVNACVSCFSIRKEAKQHGAGRWIEGAIEPGDRVVVVDDVVTTGNSTVIAIERCREFGLNVVGVIVLVDRGEQGGRERIEKELAPDHGTLGTLAGTFASVFTRADLDRAWKELASSESTPRLDQ